MNRRLLLHIANLSLRGLKSKNLTKEDLRSIRDFMLGILDGTHSLKEDEKRRLSPHKAFIRKLAYEGIKKCEMNQYCNVLLKVLKIVKPLLKRL